MTNAYNTLQAPEEDQEEAAIRFFEYIQEVIPLKSVEKEAIKQDLKFGIFPKGRVLLREGEYSTHSYFVLQGCIRKFYVVDGEEKTIAFYTEGQPINSASTLVNKTPSSYYLECLEETMTTICTSEGEEAFFARFPRFESVCRRHIEEQIAELSEVLAKYMISTPEQRYLYLLETRPKLLARVPQYHLATYIGVKPESLSRIRKRIMNR